MLPTTIDYLNDSGRWPRSGSASSFTRTSGARLISDLEPGVMRINCLPIDRLAASMSMSMAIFRFTESIYTSNSSRQRMGDPMASQSDSKRQICEKDFSPPERVFVPRPVLSLVMSGSTFKSLLGLEKQRYHLGESYL